MFKPKILRRIVSQSELMFQSPFLHRMSQLERYEFLQLCHRRRYKSGEFVYHQGDPGTGLYLIEQGSVELLHKTAGQEELTPLTMLNSPEVFGAFSIDYQIRRKLSARCSTDCILYGFFITDYQVLLKRYPRVALRLLETLNVVTVQKLDLFLERGDEQDKEPETHALLFETYDIPAEESVDEKIR